MTPWTNPADGQDAISEISQATTPMEPTLDQWFALVADRRCRQLLTILQHLPDTTVTVPELVHHLCNATAESVSVTAVREQLQCKLHHSLLPRLSDADLVAYSPDTSEIRYVPNAAFESLLARLPVDIHPSISQAQSATETDSVQTHEAILAGLANSRRRLVMHRLRTCGSMALADLADDVAVHEHNRPLTEISPQTVLRGYLSLYHTHIPRLEETMLVHYDQSADWVHLAERANVVDRYEEFFPENCHFTHSR